MLLFTWQSRQPTRQPTRQLQANALQRCLTGWILDMARRTTAKKRKLTATSGSQTRRPSTHRSKRVHLTPAQQQALLGLALLSVALLGLVSLTVLRKQDPVSRVGDLALSLLGWSAYPWSLGLALLGGTHLVEGVSDRHLLHWPRVIGPIIVWLAALAESALLFVAGTATGGGSVGTWLVHALPAGWPPVTQHGLVLLVLAAGLALTLQLRPDHLWRSGRALCGSISRLRLLRAQEPVREQRAPCPYLGQRPTYSRYGRAVADAADLPLPARQARRSVIAAADDDADDDALAFEADVASAADDPLNDLHLHRQQLGLVPHGNARLPQPIDLQDHADAVKDVSQPSLPLDQATAGPAKKATKKVPNEMEPLAPHPRLLGQPKGRAAISVPESVSTWQLPAMTLLNDPEEVKLHRFGEDVSTLAKTIQETLRSFRVDAEVRPEDVSIGPTVMRFGIRPTGKPAMKQDEQTGQMVPLRDASGKIVYEVRTRVSRIMALRNDLALVLEAKQLGMEAPVPGRAYVGVEIPHQQSHLVTLREVLESQEYQAAKAQSKLAVALGKDVAGQVCVGDLARMPHLLIAGATGSGKSVMLHAIIASILTQATPEDVRLLLIDPKMVELNLYNRIPHLLSPVVIEVDQVVSLLKNAINEMERRYRLFAQLGVRNLDGYRKLRLEKMTKGDPSLKNLPAIVLIIDELADLMMEAPAEVEDMTCRLAQLARATGMHLVIATQRPSVDVITGLMKANIPTRISFMVSSTVDSRTILDMGGAERLLGRGDMLYLPADAGRPQRIQGAFLADEEAEKLANYWREQGEGQTHLLVDVRGGAT